MSRQTKAEREADQRRTDELLTRAKCLSEIAERAISDAYEAWRALGFEGNAEACSDARRLIPGTMP